MDGDIGVKAKGEIVIEWREHQNYIGGFTNTISSYGKSVIWKKAMGNDVQYPSFISALKATKGVSRGVSYIIPMMLIGQ